MIDAQGVFNSFMAVLKDEDDAICKTIDVIWEAGKSPEPFKPAVLAVMNNIKAGRFPEISDSEASQITKLLEADPDMDIQTAGNLVYIESQLHHMLLN